MKNKQPLLSICIPTWNRSKFLTISLNRFLQDFSDDLKDDIEFYISDNCSDDDTPQVVQSYIDKGLPITYNRNEENVGADRNFLKCIERSSGKYIWLLGDDDALIPGALKFLLLQIRNKDYGLIHIKCKESSGSQEIQEYDDKEEFVKEVSYWLTFMSGNIFLKEAASLIENKEKYVKTCLLQVPFFLHSFTLRKKNLIIRRSLMDAGLDSRSNGGYNFYEVFVANYLKILAEGAQKGLYSKKCFEYLKKDICVDYIARYNWTLLIRRKELAAKKVLVGESRNGYKIDNAWKILLENYKSKGYFWLSFLTQFFSAVFKKMQILKNRFVSNSNCR